MHRPHQLPMSRSNNSRCILILTLTLILASTVQSRQKENYHEVEGFSNFISRVCQYTVQSPLLEMSQPRLRQRCTLGCPLRPQPRPLDRSVRPPPRPSGRSGGKSSGRCQGLDQPIDLQHRVLSLRQEGWSSDFWRFSVTSGQEYR